MKVGLFINTQWPEEVNVAAQIPALVEQVRVCRDAGFKLDLVPASLADGADADAADHAGDGVSGGRRAKAWCSGRTS